MRFSLVILLAAWASGCGAPRPSVSPPAPAPACAAFTVANGSNTLARVVALADLGPRNAGTAGGERAAQWIAGQLRGEGLAARLDTFTNDTPSGPLTCHNVIAELPLFQKCESGRQASAAAPPPSDWIVLLSHFDTKSDISTNFIGANDGGSSTGLLLELAQILNAAPPQHGGVLFGFVDGEECRVSFGPHDGLHGSRRLAGQLAAAHRHVRAVILLDMIGDRDLTVTLPANGSQSLTLLALEAARTVGAREKFRLFDGGILDDHQPFLDAGFPAVDLIDFVYGSAPGLNDYWHTPQDTVDKLSDASLTAVGRVVLEMVRRLDAP